MYRLPIARREETSFLGFTILLKLPSYFLSPIHWQNKKWDLNLLFPFLSNPFFLTSYNLDYYLKSSEIQEGLIIQCFDILDVFIYVAFDNIIYFFLIVSLFLKMHIHSLSRSFS